MKTLGLIAASALCIALASAADVSAVSLPASAVLMLGAFGGLSLLRQRKPI